jgi:hypothetical protein
MRFRNQVRQLKRVLIVSSSFMLIGIVRLLWSRTADEHHATLQTCSAAVVVLGAVVELAAVWHWSGSVSPGAGLECVGKVEPSAVDARAMRSGAQQDAISPHHRVYHLMQAYSERSDGGHQSTVAASGISPAG